MKCFATHEIRETNYKLNHQSLNNECSFIFVAEIWQTFGIKNDENVRRF